MSNELFAAALSQLEVGRWGVFGPTTFLDYCIKHGVEARTTASAISIDSHERLNPSLRKASAMVLRLGASPDKKGTQFVVLSAPNRLLDFFLVETEIFDASRIVTYLPEAGFRDLFPYFIFPRLTEKSLVNLAFASGLMGYALGLDKPHSLNAPVTGNSTFSFVFKAHTEYGEVMSHNNGQVEIDAVFIAKRGGRDCLFIVETKAGSDKTIAKHKLVYPVLSMASRVPADIEIIPIYMKVATEKSSIRYDLVECSIPDPRLETVAVNQLTAKRHIAVSLPIMSI